MKHAGKITITRGNYGTLATARIHVRDDEARTNFLTIEIGADELMQALMGRSEVECTFDTKNLERVGTLMQTKVVHVDAPSKFPGVGIQPEEEITALLAPHEVDGWIATRSDMTNIRRRCEGQKQAVTFCRWITPQ